jgi:hypothetical protein
VTNVLDNHFIFPDLIHNQIFSNWKTPQSRVAGRLPNIWKSGNQGCRLFYTIDKAACRFRIVAMYEKISSRSDSAPRSYRSFMVNDSG